jgi:hypothetical protein
MTTDFTIAQLAGLKDWEKVRPSRYSIRGRLCRVHVQKPHMTQCTSKGAVQ